MISAFYKKPAGISKTLYPTQKILIIANNLSSQIPFKYWALVVCKNN